MKKQQQQALPTLTLDSPVYEDALTAPLTAEERAMVPVVEAPPAPVTVSAPMAERVLELAAREGVNEAIMDKLIAWQEREAAAQAYERFNDAMSECQREMAPVARTAENSQTSSFYAKLEDVVGAISPIYLKYRFNVRFNTVEPLKPGNIRVECSVSLGRHTEHFYREAPPDTLGPKGAPVKTELHGGGSTETYLKRYALCGAFNIVFKNMDDDGNKGGAQLLTDEQQEQLLAALQAAGKNEGKFLSTMVTGVHTVEEVNQADFARLMNVLERVPRPKQEQGQ